MIWKHFIWIARKLPVWILTAAVLISVWGGADKPRKARALQDGSIEFTPNRRSFWAWPVLVVYLICATISELTHIHERPLNIIVASSLGMLTLMIVFSFPETITVTADGLEQVSWLWKNRRMAGERFYYDLSTLLGQIGALPGKPGNGME